MKKTLFRQLIFSMMLFCIVLCAVCYAVVEFYFDDYYYAQQKQVLYSRTNELAAQFDQGADIEELINDYDSLYGVSAHFLDSKTGKCTSMHGMGMQGVYSQMTSENIGRFFITASGQGMGKGQSRWLSYLTQTQSGVFVLGRISFESMDHVVGIVQQFLLYFGMAIAIAFVVFAFLFSRSMSRPLRELNAIAREMGKLNFSMRYAGNRRDEIGQLGGTLNLLTTRLENTIGQLKAELSKEKTLEKMRRQFTAQVSHELQTPLAVIKGYTEALSDDLYTGDETGGVYQILISETDKISQMVDDLLNLSQMEAGAYVIKKQPFSLASMLEKVAEDSRVLSNDKPFSIHVDTHGMAGTLYNGDPLRLEQAVRNIVTNAIKHVYAHGTITLTLRAQGRDTRIAVENEGPPIDTDDLSHIFETYYRGKSKVSGAGLGLAITRHIVERHGGTVDARNTGTGVLFEIRLP